MPLNKKVLAAALCNSGYPYRAVAEMLGGMSYIAARDAYFSLLTSFPKIERKNRRSVAIDGSDFWVDVRDYHLWLARDIDSGEIMSFQASPNASAEDGARFLSNVAALSENRPILRLGLGPNSPRGLINLDLYFQEPAGQSFIERIGKLLLLTR